MERIVEGRTLNDIARAVASARDEVNPGADLGHVIYEKVGLAREKARNNSGELWEIGQATGPRRGTALSYRVDHVLEIFGELMMMSVAASSDLALPKDLRRVKEAGITPEVVRKAEVILYESKANKAIPLKIEGRGRRKWFFGRRRNKETTQVS